VNSPSGPPGRGARHAPSIPDTGPDCASTASIRAAKTTPNPFVQFLEQLGVSQKPKYPRKPVRWGFLGRKGDGEPEAKTIWLGLREVHVPAKTLRLLREGDGDDTSV
jgi:hypothetical protein